MVGSHPPRPLAWPRPAPCRPPTDDTDASAPGDGYADWDDGPCGVMTLTRGAPTPTNNDPTVQPALTAPGSRRLSRLPTAPYLSLSDKAPDPGRYRVPCSSHLLQPQLAVHCGLPRRPASSSPTQRHHHHPPAPSSTSPCPCALSRLRPRGGHLGAACHHLRHQPPGRPSLRQLPGGQGSAQAAFGPPDHPCICGCGVSSLAPVHAACCVYSLASACVHPMSPFFLSFVRVSHYPC